MRRRAALTVIVVALFAIVGFCPAIQAQSRHGKAPRKQAKEHYVFLTGSMIPQRVINDFDATVGGSPLRIITRRRIDQTGRFTTADILRTEPYLYVRGY